MTGNPFRHSLLRDASSPALSAGPPSAPSPTPSLNSFPHHYADSSSTDGTVRETDDAPTSSRTKKSKSVRIESPRPVDEDEDPHPATTERDDQPPTQRVHGGKHAGSPPPAGFEDNFEGQASTDPWSVAQNGDDAYDARDTKGSARIESDMEAPLRSSPFGVPANPFSRTLANIEPQRLGGAEVAHAAAQNRDRTAAENTGNGTPKANLDVESFKRLLMTGVSGSPGSSHSSHNTATASSNPITPAALESSSTDTSSVSRQSIFEHALHEPHTETPRTSYEMAPSDDETVALVADVKKTEKKKPPPAPKHRHGKPMGSRTPQTVSFAEFQAIQFTPASPESHNRTNSDLNKPLPPTPAVVSPPSHIISQDITQEPSQDAPPLDSSSSTLSVQTHMPPLAAQKKIPPPVPLARRQSQLRTSSGNRSRSSSNLTASSQHSIPELPLSSPPTFSETASTTSSHSHKVPPPPPPSRRHGSSLAGGAPASANSSTTELPSSPSSARRINMSSSPEAPSSRKTTVASPSPSASPMLGGGNSTPMLALSRTASASSGHRNTNTSRSISAESSSHMAPPPPPPPRRRQSGRSSLDRSHHNTTNHSSQHSPAESRRPSSEYKRHSFDITGHNNRRTSVASESSLKYEYSPSMERGDPLYSPREEPLYSPREEVEEWKALGVGEGGGLVGENLTHTDSKDILDDMEKFQREIDELRSSVERTMLDYGLSEQSTELKERRRRWMTW